jgi:hypothetical protein
VDKNHPILRSDALQQEADAYVEQLADLMSSDANSNHVRATALLTTLGALARQRPQFVDTIVRKLLEYALHHHAYS